MATLAFLSTDELRDLLALVITGVAGGEEAGWRDRIAIERVPTWRRVRVRCIDSWVQQGQAFRCRSKASAAG